MPGLLAGTSREIRWSDLLLRNLSAKSVALEASVSIEGSVAAEGVPLEGTPEDVAGGGGGGGVEEGAGLGATKELRLRALRRETPMVVFLVLGGMYTEKARRKMRKTENVEDSGSF